MKFVTFPRLMKWMFATGFTFLLLMFILRLAFFYHFKSDQYTFGNSLNALLLGLRYDLRVVCAIVLVPYLAGNVKLVYKKNNRLKAGSIIRIVLALLLLVALILFMLKGHSGIGPIIFLLFLYVLFFIWLFSTKNCNPFENRGSANVFKTYFFIVSIFLALFYAFDFEHYDYLHQRLNASILNFAGDAKISMNMAWETYPVVTLLFAVTVVSVLLYVLINLWFKYFKDAPFTGHGIARIVLSYIFIFLLALGIFGRLNQYPLRWSDAFSFDDDFKANLALNPVQSFLSTLQFRSSTYAIQKVKEFYPLMAAYLGVDHPDSTTLNYRRTFQPANTTNKPNVVIVICESFSAYKSSMWGNPLNTTPFFNEMCKNGILFDRCFTPSYGTARGVWAVITGIPDVEYPNTSSRNPAFVDQHSLMNDYKGYEKFYFLGGSTSWANIRGLLTNNISGLKIYEEESYKAETVDVWGISDKRLFLAANNAFAKQKTPFVAIIQTADNHRPYTIPDEDRKEFSLKKYSEDSLKRFGFQSNDELNAFRYTDFSFEKFIEAAKKEKYFDNTIFVFVGDHGIRGDAGNMFPKAWTIDGLTTGHVPLLFYAPALLPPARINRTCSQVDVFPSVTALANIPYVNTTMGRNLFDTIPPQVPFPHAAFLYDYNIKQIGMVTDDYLYEHNLITGKQDFRSSKNDDELPPNSDTETVRKSLQTLSRAYYETARYMLLKNKKENKE